MSPGIRIQIASFVIFIILSFFPAHAIAGKRKINRIPAKYASSYDDPVEATASKNSSDDPTADKALEKRLKKKSFYTIKQGDTLRRVSHFLYGHYSWWTKLKSRNPKFRKYREDDPLPAGQKLAYLAPVVGDVYVVRKNDWLARIAQWKYGDSELWQELFRKNMASIKNPDLIHPGDKLLLGVDGTVKKADTGEILMKGTAEVVQQVQQIVPKVDPEQTAREIAAKTETAFSGFWAWSSEQPYFFFGFLSGLALLLAMVFYALIQRFRFTPAISDPAPSPRNRKQEIEDDEEEVQSMLRQNLQGGYPEDFKRRPLEDPTFDRTLMREEEPEIDLRPSYNRLFGRLKAWKNYLNIKRKK